MVRSKVRIRFCKGGDARFVSHHDLMRCFERMLRRADIPFHSTSGFNPRPRLVFALSLGLGIVGRQEVLELELDAEVAADVVAARLQAQCPDGLEILSARHIDPKATARVVSVTYRAVLPSPAPDDLRSRCESILGSAQCCVERLRPQPRRVDIRPFLREFRVSADSLEMDFLVTPNGSARPDEVLRLLGLGELLERAVPLERSTLEIADERRVRPVPEETLAASGLPGAFPVEAYSPVGPDLPARAGALPDGRAGAQPKGIA